MFIFFTSKQLTKNSKVKICNTVLYNVYMYVRSYMKKDIFNNIEIFIPFITV